MENDDAGLGASQPTVSVNATGLPQMLPSYMTKEQVVSQHVFSHFTGTKILFNIPTAPCVTSKSAK